MAESERKAEEREARQRYEGAVERIRDGNYRFTSKVRGQAGIVLEELLDPEGEAVRALADVEGEAGALALAMPIDLITFETWLFGQIGDHESLDLDVAAHQEFWFNFGAWIGETMRRRHGGHWLIPGDDPRSWRLGFSKIMLEVIPWVFAEQLLRAQSGSVKAMIGEIEKLRIRHDEQKAKDNGQEIDRFTAGHYVRLHTVPLGQWMVMDMHLLGRLWTQAATRDLIKEIKKAGARLGPENQPIVDQIAQALEKADGNKPIAQQTQDRALFEAVAQIVALRRTTPPLAIDIIEAMVMPAMHMGIPDSFPPLDEDDLEFMRKGADLFALMIECVPYKFKADDQGFLRSIPQENLASPYGQQRELDIGKGDWVMVNPGPLKEMLFDFDSKRLLARFDEFVTYLRDNPEAPRRRDDGRYLVEQVAKSLADLRACVVAASQEGHALLFRLLPPPA
jgi:hypothetical protein